MSKKCFCIGGIVVGSVVVVLVGIIALMVTCIIPGICIDRSPILAIIETKAFDTGSDPYTVVAGRDFWYIHKAGVNTGTLVYTIYYDDSEEIVSFSLDMDKYGLFGMTKDNAIVSVDDDSAKVLVFDHAGVEVGEFTIGCNESFYYFGEDWLVTQNLVAGKYYFYYKFGETYSQSTFFVDWKQTTDEDKGLTYFDDYDEVLITYVKDNTVDPAKYTYTWWIFEEESFVQREEVVSGITGWIEGVFYNDEFVAIDTGTTTTDMKLYHADWTSPTISTWTTSVTAGSDQHVSNQLISARAWVILNNKATGSQTDSIPNFYDLRSFEDGVSTLKLEMDAAAGLISTISMNWLAKYALMQYFKDGTYSIKKLIFD